MGERSERWAWARLAELEKENRRLRRALKSRPAAAKKEQPFSVALPLKRWRKPTGGYARWPQKAVKR